MGKGKNLRALTGVRFFAAFWVLVYHQSTPGGLLEHLLGNGPAWLFHLARTGPAAVGLFFVLSGFILAYNYDRGPMDRAEFWWARFARVYPVYLLGLLLVAPSTLTKIFLHQLPEHELFHGLGSLLLLQAWNPGAALSWNAVGWSLSAEAFFYLVFPFVLIAIDRLSRRGLVLGMAAMWGLILFVPTLCVARHLPDFADVMATDLPSGTWCNVVKFNPLIRLPEFIFGVLLGRLFLLRPREERDSPYGWMLSIPGLVVLLAVCATLAPHIPYPYLHNNALIVCFALIIYGLACGRGILDKFLSHPWLTKLGQASYAIYILHVPIDDWVMRIDKKTLHWAVRHPAPLFVLYVAAVVVVSIVVFQWIEEPARKYLRKRFARPAASEQAAAPSVAYAQ